MRYVARRLRQWSNASASSDLLSPRWCRPNLTGLVEACRDQIPDGFLQHLPHVSFNVSSVSKPAKNATPVVDLPAFPCPMKEQEATASIRALEGVAAAALADVRFGPSPRKISVDVRKVACYLMSAYLTTIDSQSKTDADIKHKLPGQHKPERHLEPISGLSPLTDMLE